MIKTSSKLEMERHAHLAKGHLQKPTGEHYT